LNRDPVPETSTSRSRAFVIQMSNVRYLDNEILESGLTVMEIKESITTHQSR